MQQQSSFNHNVTNVKKEVINFPSYVSSSSTNNNQNNSNGNSENLDISDFDFNFLSEYLLEEERQGSPAQKSSAMNSKIRIGNGVTMSRIGGVVSNSGLQSVGLEDGGSDEEDEDDFSSADDKDGKKRKTDGKSKSKDQLDRRRERNRVLARKTRLRKKFFFESLQRQVNQLALENDMLKGVIKQKFDIETQSKVLGNCQDFSDIPSILKNSSSEGDNAVTSILEQQDYKLVSAIQAAQRSFVITDPSLPDNPIIFASKGFLELSLYSLHDVLGRNCRFMQGPNTDPEQVEVLRKGIAEGVDTSVCLLNYKADGTQFHNQIFVAALRDSNSNVINYVGVQLEIINASGKGVKDRSKSALKGAMIESMTTTSDNSAPSKSSSYTSSSAKSNQMKAEKTSKKSKA